MSKLIKIKDVAKLNLSTYKKDDFPSKIFYLDTSNLTKNRIENFQIFESKTDDIPSRAQRKIKQNTILYSTVRPNQEHFGIIEKPIENIVVSTGFTTIDVNDKEISPKYLFYLITQTHITEYLHTIATNSVSAYPSISPNEIGNLEFSIPDLNTQQKIVSVLSSLDAKIELNNRINAELEAMAKTLYDYWFVQFEFPNEEGKPYKSSGGKMVWNEELKREVPEGWEVEPLFKAMDVQYGFPFSTSKFTDEVTDKPVIRIRDILENTISTYSTEEVDVKYRLKQNDLLIGMDGNFHLNFWDKDGAYLNQRSVRIRAKKNSKISNLQAYFELKPYIKARENNVSRTTVGHLSDKDLKRLFLISPSKSKSFKPDVILDSLLNKIISNRLQNQQITKIRDWLLPMLMNGQVKVG